MPNRKPHAPNNPKPRHLPLNLLMILGYTGKFGLGKNPTVYFNLGHFTQEHSIDWNVGWESLYGWECKFFGNVKYTDGISWDLDSSRRPSVLKHRQNITDTNKYVAELEKLGKNRFDESLRKWNLDGNLTQDFHLREFWIRNGGLKKEDQFAHASEHGLFTPVPYGDLRTRLKL